MLNFVIKLVNLRLPIITYVSVDVNATSNIFSYNKSSITAQRTDFNVALLLLKHHSIPQDGILVNNFLFTQGQILLSLLLSFLSFFIKNCMKYNNCLFVCLF